MNTFRILFIFAITLSLFSCRRKGCTNSEAQNYNPNAKVEDGSCILNGSKAPTTLDLEIPELFAYLNVNPTVPVDNSTTVEGVALGKKLFFDKRLSSNRLLSCASCHIPNNAFGDSVKYSVEISGNVKRNTRPIFNLAWDSKFYWGGRAISIENQVLQSIRNKEEMHNDWNTVIATIKLDGNYIELFKQAFNTTQIDSNLVAKAIAQYERTLISGNTRFDKFLMRKINLTTSELNGYNLFLAESGGDCFHCHGDATNPLWTDNLYHNNGLDASFTDNGLGEITGNPSDNGKFKTPSLRNLKYTAPYMHDGRFKTLDEVLDHYSEGLVHSATVSPLLKQISKGGVQLNSQEKADLKAFLLTLTDEEFVTVN